MTGPYDDTPPAHIHTKPALHSNTMEMRVALCFGVGYLAAPEENQPLCETKKKRKVQIHERHEIRGEEAVPERHFHSTCDCV